jgi:hypothetical protein
MKKRCVNYVLLVLVLSFLSTLMPYKVWGISNKKNVLIIQSYNSGYKWSDDIKKLTSLAKTPSRLCIN